MTRPFTRMEPPERAHVPFSPALRWVVLPLLILFVGAILVYGVFDLSRSTRAHFFWTPVHASVERVERSGKGFMIFYRYPVRDVVYSGSDLFDRALKAGDEVDVRYNPDMPSQSLAHFFWTIYLFVPLFALAEVVIIYGWLHDVFRTRK